MAEATFEVFRGDRELLGLALLVDVQILQTFRQDLRDLISSLGEDHVGDRDAGLAEEVVLAFALAGVLLLQG